jgi:16S rRNA (cytosine967-C5)-methyltransferase
VSEGDSARRIALEALVRVDEGAFAHILVPDMLRHRNLSGRDRALVTELVYGTVRMRRAVDDLLAQVSSRPLEEIDERVHAALRLGAYQLLLGMPPHAAVGETVNLVSARARGFANAVLRAVSRLGPPYPLPDGTDVQSIAVRTSHPDWIVQLLVDEFGLDDAVATLELDDEPPPVTLRVHPMRTTVDEIETELRNLGVVAERGQLVRDALLVRHTGDLALLPAVHDGRVTPQDQASQAIVRLLAPQPGDLVLDLASAPGGKSTAAAELMHGDGLVVAADIYPGRVRTVMRAARRLHLERAIVPLLADGSYPPVRSCSFDRVLLDAPCSGLGVLRRRPDARWRVEPNDVDELAALQRQLLMAAAEIVRPGGRLVYSVCTVTPAETRAVDEWAVHALPEFVACTPPDPPWRPHGRGALLLPSDARTDGMFVLVLERSTKAVHAPPPPVERHEEPPPEPPEPPAPPAPPAPAPPGRWSRVA